MTSPGSVTTSVEEKKYVHIEGRVQVEFALEPVTNENALKLSFLDESFQVRTDVQSLFFYLDTPVKFKHAHLIAEFNQQGFENHKATLQKIDPFTGEWDTLEASDGDGDMNPSGPPKPKP